MKAISDFISMFTHIFTMKDFFENWITHGTISLHLHSLEPKLSWCFLSLTRLGNTQKFDLASLLFSQPRHRIFISYFTANLTFLSASICLFMARGTFTQLCTVKKRFSSSFHYYFKAFFSNTFSR